MEGVAHDAERQQTLIGGQSNSGSPGREAQEGQPLLGRVEGCPAHSLSCPTRLHLTRRLPLSRTPINRATARRASAAPQPNAASAP